jgi:hypothetical protein
MNRLVLFIFFVSFTVSACAQPKAAKTKEEIIAACDKLMQTFKEGKFKAAMQSLKPISLIQPSKINDLAEQANDQMTALAGTYGKMVAYDLVNEKAIKDFIYKRSYILRFERYYLKFSFVYYKAATGWAITHFVYNEEIDELFK